MADLLLVVLPVFVVIGFGYVAAWRGLFSADAVETLMLFSQKFAIPCLLFRAIADLDLGAEFNLALLGSFYGGAVLCFAVGMLGARLLFHRPWPDCVAIGFVCLFSNSVLLGLPIMERAYGPSSMGGNFAIIAVHAPFAYGLGITVMEIVVARGAPPAQVARKVLKAMFSNAIIIGIALGFAVNLSGVTVPGAIWEGVDLMARAALPTALFAMGGVLYRYRPEGDMVTVAFMCAVSLLLHPALVWGFAGVAGLSTEALRSAIVTAAMAPGVNAYIFANMYGVAKRVAASSVLMATALTVVTATGWLALLP